MQGNRNGFRGWQAVLALTAVLCGGAAVALADRFPPDPVEALRQVLNARAVPSKAREKALQAAIEDLRTLGQMRRALALQEWGDTDPDETIAAVDQPARKELATRFEQGVRAALTAADPTTRRAAADMLAEIGTTVRGVGTAVGGLARDFGPDLAERVRKDVPAVRVTAARALGLVNPDPEVAVPALAELLRAPTAAERAAAAEAFYNLVYTASWNATRPTGAGGQGVVVLPAEVVAVGKAVIPEASRALGDPSPLVRRSAADALNQSAQAITKLVPEPRAGDEFLPADPLRKGGRDVAGDPNILQPMLAAFKNEAQVLARGVHDPDAEVRLRVRRTLEELGVGRVRLLRRAQSQADAERELKGELKERLTIPTLPEDPLLDTLRPALPALAAGLRDRNVQARLAALDALEPMITKAGPAAPALVQALGDDDRFVRWAAARTLGRIGPVPGVDAVTPLARMLRDPDLDLARGAALALSRYGPAAKDAVPALIALLRAASDAELRVAVVHTLEGIGTDAQPAVPALSRALADPDVRVRQVAAEALGMFGPAAAEAVPALRRALDDDSPDVRRAASDALLSILPTK
jgi:HEAT repeat protein